MREQYHFIAYYIHVYSARFKIVNRFEMTQTFWSANWPNPFAAVVEYQRGLVEARGTSILVEANWVET